MLKDRIYNAVCELAERRRARSYTQLAAIIREVIESLVSTSADEDELHKIDGPAMVESLCLQFSIVTPSNLFAIQRSIVGILIRERETDASETEIRGRLDQAIADLDGKGDWLLEDDRDNLIAAVLYDLKKLREQNRETLSRLMDSLAPYRNLVTTCHRCVEKGKVPIIVSTCTRQYCKQCGRVYWTHPNAIPFKELPDGMLFRLLSDDDTTYCKVPLHNMPIAPDRDDVQVASNMVVIYGDPLQKGLGGRCGSEALIVPEQDFSIAGGSFIPN